MPGETQLMRRGASSAASGFVRCSTGAPTEASEIYPGRGRLAGVAPGFGFRRSRDLSPARPDPAGRRAPGAAP